MNAPTPIDAAHAAMMAAPDDDTMRLRFYERIADGEMFLMLSEEMAGETVRPDMFDLAEGRFVLAFDREERLTQFAGRAVPYAALAGRALAQMLAGQGVGLGLNLEVAPSSILIPPAAVQWLAAATAQAPAKIEARLVEVAAPAGLPETLIAALDTKLATAAGMARHAYLVAATYDSGARGHMLCFVDAAEGAQDALAQATGEALAFSGIEAGALDVGFVTGGEPVAARLARAGLRFDLPVPAGPAVPSPAPGGDPGKPPKLR